MVLCLDTDEAMYVPQSATRQFQSLSTLAGSPAPTPRAYYCSDDINFLCALVFLFRARRRPPAAGHRGRYLAPGRPLSEALGAHPGRPPVQVHKYGKASGYVVEYGIAKDYSSY